MGRNAKFARTASEDDLAQADAALMFYDSEDMADQPAAATAATTTATTATSVTATASTSSSSSSSRPSSRATRSSSTTPDTSCSPGSGLYTAATNTTTSATGAESAAAVAAPSRAAKRAPRAPPSHAPPVLPATAAEVTDLASFSRLVTALSTTIVKAVQDGKSVTAPNKRLIILAAEETRRAMAAFERTMAPPATGTTAPPRPCATSVAPSAPSAPAGPPAATAPAAPADEASSRLKRELAACVREEFVKLKAELSQDARRAAARAPPVPTYAQMARAPQPQHQQQQRAAAPFKAQPPLRATRPAIVVATTAPVAGRQQAVEAFRRSISFRASNYAPARVQPVSHNKLRVEFDTEQQRADALLRLSGASEVTAEPARSLRPMLILKGINKSTPVNELVDIVRRQNDCMDGELALKFERKNRNVNLYSAVLVASPDVWRKLVGLGRVGVDHQRVHVERFSPFVQCFACLQFGHVRKNCVPTALKPCALCASAAHQELDCPVKGDKNNFKCYNCSNRNIKFNNSDPINHKATSGSCSVLRAMRARVESRVDYGLP